MGMRVENEMGHGFAYQRWYCFVIADERRATRGDGRATCERMVTGIRKKIDNRRDEIGMAIEMNGYGEGRGSAKHNGEHLHFVLKFI